MLMVTSLLIVYFVFSTGFFSNQVFFLNFQTATKSVILIQDYATQQYSKQFMLWKH